MALSGSGLCLGEHETHSSIQDETMLTGLEALNCQSLDVHDVRASGYLEDSVSPI